MQFDGDTLTIEPGMSLEELREFEAFVRPRLEYIETIEVEEGALGSSALLALLASIKRTRPELVIPYLAKGKTTPPGQGRIHWICHD